MAERRATNKYYPPEWTPSQGSLNTFRGQHPLRERARRLASHGILVVRFEMPFNIWCGGCGVHIGRGVRFNADKTTVGAYFTTPILQFAMKCPHCAHRIEIQTDPQHTRYVVHAGASQQIMGNTDETADAAGALEQSEHDDDNAALAAIAGEALSPDQRAKIASDPMARLEHGLADQRVAEAARPVLEQLQLDRDRKYADSYATNSALRASHRQLRREAQQQQQEADRIRAKYGLNMAILPSRPTDRVEAAQVHFAQRSIRNQARALRLTSLFDPAAQRRSMRARLRTQSAAEALQQQVRLAALATHRQNRSPEPMVLRPRARSTSHSSDGSHPASAADQPAPRSLHSLCDYTSDV